MKILKYLIFFSILCVIFSVIYRQSDKKGFRRWRTSFKTAIIFSAIAAGLIPVNPEAIEPPGNIIIKYISNDYFQIKNLIRLKTIIKKLFSLKQAIVHLRFRLHLEEGNRIHFLHPRLEADLLGLQRGLILMVFTD